MRLFVFILLAFGLHAQESAPPLSPAQKALQEFLSQRTQSNAIPPDRSQKVIEESLRNKAMMMLAMQQKVLREPQLKVCSVPLLDATPKAQGTIRTITPPDTEPNMPKLRMPAPPCK